MSIRAHFHTRLGGFKLAADLDVPAQGITALFGPSGCGKTTLLRAMAGLDYHRGGELSVAGDQWQGPEHFLKPHQRPVGLVFQEASLFPHLDVRGNIEYGYRRVPAQDRRVQVEQLIELLDLPALLPRKTDSLSGGERQRVAMARALAVSPRLLLLDEPLASLDLSRKRDILPYIERFQRELDIPVIYVSHAPEEVARLAHHLVLMDNGRISAAGPIEQLLTRLDLPLAHELDATSIIRATVARHDDQYQLSVLDFPAGEFIVPRVPLDTGQPVRVQLAARDISLTLERQQDTSILNIFPATVDAISTDGGAQLTVRLLAGEVPLLARITRKSAAALGLQPGKRLYAQAKSVAVLA